MEFIKKNFVLILAFALPVALVAIVVLSTYLPSMFISTNYNFVYALCDDDYYYGSYNCNDYLRERYTVEEGKLVENVVIADILPDGQKINDGKNLDARVFLHNTEKNESREITIEEAQTLDLQDLLTSPDGVTVSSHYDSDADIFPFYNGRSSYGYYLTKGKSRSKINLINYSDRYYYRNNFQFIGWILPGRN
ncbi:MAG: hypothetical protein U9P50_03020 [Patescibacteria group bacterium]|nr:hypothetical protein [Patescibacteria group bacterium]